jgi:hypothetical protein
MSKSLLQAARLQKQNKVLGRTYTALPLSRVRVTPLRASVAMLC